MNNYGLSRDIPEPVKREIRQRCGFGCVVCGSAIYQYEHFDPGFADAKIHGPSGMTLLCGSCHQLKTRRFWSNEKIIRHNQNPFCMNAGYSWGPFDLGEEFPEVVLGGYRAINTPLLLEICGAPLLAVELPEEAGGPFRLTARFFDSQNRELLTIDKNEWKSDPKTWDVEVVGPVITFRIAPGVIALVLRAKPPNGLIVERLDMQFHRTRLEVNGDEITIVTSSGASLSHLGGTTSVNSQERGIVIDQDGNLTIGG